MNNSCLNCTERHTGCHSECESYLQFKQEKQLINDNRYSYLNSRTFTISQKNNINNMLKRRK